MNDILRADPNFRIGTDVYLRLPKLVSWISTQLTQFFLTRLQGTNLEGSEI